MLTCHEIADYFLTKVDEAEGDLMSNLKLQKLVYYAQGFHLAIFGAPLFEEEIFAWQHGPVVPDLYHRFKEHGAGVIPMPTQLDLTRFPAATLDFLDEVYDLFGQFSAWRLRDMTHEEPPWVDAKENAGEITHEALSRYFKTRLVGA